MDENILDRVKKLHFVGIGGSGMCPMAEILHHKGFQLTGSDINESDTLERIKGYGIPVAMGHKAENIGDAECVVYTAACKADNPELVAAREKGIPTLERSVMLGMLTEKFKRPVAVSGTHGKTTTTAMLTEVLIDGGLDPSAIIGGKLPMLGANSRVGRSETIVVEACEYVDTFLQLHPAVSVILNIDADHLDYFKTVDNIVKSFHQFGEQTSQLVVVNGDNAKAMESVRGLQAKIVTFGMKDTNDYYPTEMNEEDTACEDFTLTYHGEKLGRVNLSVPGEHNMMNAVAAAAAAHCLGVAPEVICSTLGKFTGVHRRFEVLGKFEGVTVADDFAHHPTELTAVLTSAMKMGYRQVWAVFQPHTYSRTYNLLEDFAQALSIPDHLVMTEILAVREENKWGIHTSDLAAKVPGSVWFDSFEKIADYVMEQAQPGDLILTLGGGDIYKCANLIVEKYKARMFSGSWAMRWSTWPSLSVASCPFKVMTPSKGKMSRKKVVIAGKRPVATHSRTPFRCKARRQAKVEGGTFPVAESSKVPSMSKKMARIIQSVLSVYGRNASSSWGSTPYCSAQSFTPSKISSRE